MILKGWLAFLFGLDVFPPLAPSLFEDNKRCLRGTEFCWVCLLSLLLKKIFERKALSHR